MSCITSENFSNYNGRSMEVDGGIPINVKKRNEMHDLIFSITLIIILKYVLCLN